MLYGALLFSYFAYILITGNINGTKTTIAIIALSLISMLMLIFFLSTENRLEEPYYNLRGRVKGFKNFLRYAKKEELELLVRENPEYYYDILPYTMALGISKI